MLREMKIWVLFTLLSVSSATKWYTNPVVDDNHPDPGILKLPDGHGTGYVVVSTTDHGNRTDNVPAFPIMHSENLIDWTVVSRVLIGALLVPQ